MEFKLFPVIFQKTWRGVYQIIISGQLILVAIQIPVKWYDFPVMFTRYLDIPGTLSKMAISGPMKHAVLAASGRQPAAGSSTPALQAPFQRWFFPENHRDIEGDIHMDCLYGYHYGPEPKKWICRCENGWLPIHSHNMTERFTIFDNLKRPHHSLMVNKVVKPKTILQFGDGVYHLFLDYSSYRT